MTQDLELDGASDLTVRIAFSIFGTFLYLLLASVALGTLLGLVTALCLRRLSFHGTQHEVSFIGLMAYLSYLLGEVTDLSGIVALFVAAIIISHYALHNISKQSRQGLGWTLHTVHLGGCTRHRSRRGTTRCNARLAPASNPSRTPVHQDHDHPSLCHVELHLRGHHLHHLWHGCPGSRQVEGVNMGMHVWVHCSRKGRVLGIGGVGGEEGRWINAPQS